MLGLDGVEQKKQLCKPCNRNLYQVSIDEGLPLLPRDLREAIDVARSSEFVQKVLPESVRTQFFNRQEALWQRYGTGKQWKEEIAAYLPYC